MKKITVTDIFQNSKYIRYKILLDFIYDQSEYVNIKGKIKLKHLRYLLVIIEPGKIKLKHLRYLLCRKHGLRLNHLPPSEREKIKDDAGVFIRNIVNDQYKFPNEIRLSEALRKLMELGLVERTSDKCYKITPLGCCEWDKDYLFWFIDANFPTDPYKASELTDKIKELFPDDSIKKMLEKAWEE